MPPSMQRRACGRSWIAFRAIAAPSLLRGDSGFGTEAVMRKAEQRGLPDPFKLRLTANVPKLIKKTFSKDDWTNAGQGWQGREDTLRLEGWSRQRQVVILRRRLKEGLAVSGRDEAGQLALGFAEIGRKPRSTNTACLPPPSTRRF